jgi:hypothetical protein
LAARSAASDKAGKPSIVGLKSLPQQSSTCLRECPDRQQLSCALTGNFWVGSRTHASDVHTLCLPPPTLHTPTSPFTHLPHTPARGTRAFTSTHARCAHVCMRTRKRSHMNDAHMCAYTRAHSLRRSHPFSA